VSAAAVPPSSPSSSLAASESASGVNNARQVDSAVARQSPQTAAGSKRKRTSPPASPSSVRPHSSESAVAVASSVFLFNEQYVCKPAHRPSAQFGWHTDSAEQLALFDGQTDRSARNHPRYVACWMALDDMTQSNGTLRIVPRTAMHAWEEACAASGAPAAAAPPPDSAWLFAHSHLLRVPSGSAVLFDGDTWHASEGNDSDAPRRVFYAQYSAQPIATERSPTDSALASAASIAAPAASMAAPVEPPCAVSTAKRQRSHTAGQPSSSVSDVGAAAAAPHPSAVCPCCHTSACAALLRCWDVLSFAIPCAWDDTSADGTPLCSPPS
jgi:hypothetical protein